VEGYSGTKWTVFTADFIRKYGRYPDFQLLELQDWRYVGIAGKVRYVWP
jgi:hypothetical protein